MLPAFVASADGPLPTGIVARTASVRGSILEIVESRLFATHSEPLWTASATGPLPTRTRPIARPVDGSSFSTAASS